MKLPVLSSAVQRSTAGAPRTAAGRDGAQAQSSRTIWLQPFEGAGASMLPPGLPPYPFEELEIAQAHPMWSVLIHSHSARRNVRLWASRRVPGFIGVPRCQVSCR